MNKLLPILLVFVYSSSSFSEDFFVEKMASAYVARDHIDCGAYWMIARDSTRHSTEDYQTFNDAALQFFKAGEKYAKMGGMSKNDFKHIQQLAYSTLKKEIKSNYDNFHILKKQYNEYCNNLIEDPKPVILHYLKYVNGIMKEDE
jgi:hypothetical protein